MKRSATVFLSLFSVAAVIIFAFGTTGCANIIPPTGGPRDSLPPVLVMSTPPDSAINYKGNRITLIFDEYVSLENAFENVLVSPVPKNVPQIESKLRNVTVKLRDTLEENTTYSINFGNAIKDVNEGNIFKDFTYVFSTGPNLDDNKLAGKITLAESGKFDSTLVAALYQNMDDSAVAKEKPRYIARVDGKGNFRFNNLPAGTFALYAIPNSFTLRYDDTTRPFAFYGQPVNLDSNIQNIQMYAFSKPKVTAVKATSAAAASKEKQLRFSANIEGGSFDFLDVLHLDFNRPITTYDSTKIRLTDKDGAPFNALTIVPDTNQTRFNLLFAWQPNTDYKLILEKEAFADSTGLTLSKNDTISFATKREEDYGSLKIRFNNLDTTKHPVLQLVQNDVLVISEALTQRDWLRKLVKPGSYAVRILYDTNQNGKWDTGEFFGEHRQPEIVKDLGISVDVRGNWDNEKTITLQ